MQETTTLSELLSSKIERLIEAHKHLKSENQMLIEELRESKVRLQEQEEALIRYDGSADIKEKDIEAIIEKLERALGDH